MSTYLYTSQTQINGNVGFLASRILETVVPFFDHGGVWGQEVGWGQQRWIAHATLPDIQLHLSTCFMLRYFEFTSPCTLS